MVQLKAWKPEPEKHVWLISIPYGSIKRRPATGTLSVQVTFQFLMVQLKDALSVKLGYQALAISIPYGSIKSSQQVFR